jgi:hypothetical protein
VVSNAQESGLDAAWFAHEVTHRCRFSPRPHEPRLVTTWSDGENGGWFRQMHEGSGFFGHYFAPYMEHVRGGEYPIRPVGLSGYLAEHPPEARARVQTGAWNVGSTSGFDFSQWAGSPGQQRAGEALTALSRRWWSLQGRAERLPPAAREELAAVRRQVLEAETSCYLFWGDDWLPKLDAILEPAGRRLDAIEQARAQAQSGAPAGAARPLAPSGGGTEQPAAAEPSVPAAAPAGAPVAVRTPAAAPGASGGRSGALPAADTGRAFPNTTAGEPGIAVASAPDADAVPVATASAAAKTAGPRPKPAQARERAAGTKPAGTAGKPMTKKTGSGSRASKTTGSRR